MLFLEGHPALTALSVHPGMHAYTGNALINCPKRQGANLVKHIALYLQIAEKLPLGQGAYLQIAAGIGVADLADLVLRAFVASVLIPLIVTVTPFVMLITKPMEKGLPVVDAVVVDVTSAALAEKMENVNPQGKARAGARTPKIGLFVRCARTEVVSLWLKDVLRAKNIRCVGKELAGISADLTHFP